jgi:hypothetical protein
MKIKVQLILQWFSNAIEIALKIFQAGVGGSFEILESTFD